jgi:hypothetical protein
VEIARFATGLFCRSPPVQSKRCRARPLCTSSTVQLAVCQIARQHSSRAPQLARPRSSPSGPAARHPPRSSPPTLAPPAHHSPSTLAAQPPPAARPPPTARQPCSYSDVKLSRCVGLRSAGRPASRPRAAQLASCAPCLSQIEFCGARSL